MYNTGLFPIEYNWSAMVPHCLLLLLILTSLFHAISSYSSSIYHVIPDDHYTADNNTYTLQHYLNNVNKYFTSHTQLHFLPGQYYLNTDLIIQHVSNLSLIGNRTNEVINSVIKCTSPAGIVVVGSSNIVIENIVMNECGSHFNNSVTVNQSFTKYYQSLLILDCHTVTCMYFHSKWSYIPSGIKFVNAFGNTTILQVVSSHLKLWYSDINNPRFNFTHTIHIESYQSHGTIYYTYALDIQMFRSNFHIAVTMLNINFHNKFALRASFIETLGHNMITVANCSFSKREMYPINRFMQRHNDDVLCGNYNQSINMDFCKIFLASNFGSMIYCFHNNDRRLTDSNTINFTHCRFDYISKPILSKDRLLYFLQYGIKTTTAAVEYVQVSINNCLFYNMNFVQTMTFESYTVNYDTFLVLINNVKVARSRITYNVINIRSVKLHVENLIITSILIISPYKQNSFIEAKQSYVEFNCYNEFSYNVAMGAISSPVIYLQENTKLNFTLNKFSSIIITPGEQQVVLVTNNMNDLELCAIQYISKRGNLDTKFRLEQKLNYSIILYKNINTKEISTFSASTLMHCAWDANSTFLNSIPFYVNQRFIESDSLVLEETKKSLCVCNLNSTYICYKGILGPFYPGQTALIFFSLDKEFVNAARIEIIKDNSKFACRNENFMHIQLESRECKALNYRVQHSNEWCVLSLTARPLSVENPSFTGRWIERYTILLQLCPLGFSLHPQGYCQCDPILSSHIISLTTCDIDHQTIPRPVNTWISAHTINNSHSYHVSLHCPFDYCLPHSSQLNLSTPDSQCQFNRSGVLCGQCQHGLSTVFGSSQCKHCSIFYLLIIIPVGIAGLLLILLLFVFNLTVANGDINSFILYANIVNINTSIFFQKDKSILHTFIALTNLDIGIETCFYNGMDDYAKMWLQLVFPIYLIFIATLLIITSQYSTTIQRLTTRRALPVLATLFLLSYTKVLLTVSNVLFSYTSITHLPSNHTTLVWSVDTSVPLFGVKFTILFIACLILFLILLLIKVVLIFTKKLSYFKVVFYIKPLLDAYHFPYKIKFRCWIGLQLIMRAAFSGLAALDRNTNLTVGTILIVVLIWLQERIAPFKSKLNNYLEILYLFNLFVIFVISLYTASNYIVINAFISIAMIQELCIILWHIKKLMWNNCAAWFFPAKRFTNCLSNIYFKRIHEIDLPNEVPENFQT